VVISLDSERPVRPASIGDAGIIAGLCRRLVDASLLPAAESRRVYVAEALAATGMDVAVIADGSPDGPQWVGAVASRGNVGDLPDEGDLLPGPSWPDHMGAVTVARNAFGGGHANQEEPAGEVVLLSFTGHPMDHMELMVLDVVASFATLTGPRGEHLPRIHGRLREHLASALRTRDVTGNGISVARGWLDHLATGELDEETRGLGKDAVQRRLAEVQIAVDAFIHTTTHALTSDSSGGRADLLHAWWTATSTRLSTTPPLRGSDATLDVVAHASALDAFLSTAASLLAPEATLLADRVLVPLTDPSRMDDETRALLGASLGGLTVDRDGAFVDWQRAREPDASDPPPSDDSPHRP
jgi:hypothetical protein